MSLASFDSHAAHDRLRETCTLHAAKEESALT